MTMLTELEEKVQVATRSWADDMPKTLKSATKAATEAMDLTGESIGLIDAKVELFAVVKSNSSGGRGVCQLGSYELSDLYFDNDSPLLAFSSALTAIIKKIASFSDQDEIAANIAADRVWFSISQLKSYLGKIDAAHDEAIMLLLSSACKWKSEPVDIRALGAVSTVLSQLQNRVKYSDTLLDECAETLEAVGLELGFSSSL